MIDASFYTIEIRKGIFDGEECYRAKAKEFPNLEDYADSYEEAYALISESIGMSLEILQAQGKKAPVPVDDSVLDYSGRVTLRLPKSLHANLAHLAEYEEVSLNQYIVTALAQHNGFEVSSFERQSGLYASFCGLTRGAFTSFTHGRKRSLSVKEYANDTTYASNGALTA